MARNDFTIGDVLRLGGAALVLLLALVATLLGRLPLYVPVAYLLLGLLSFGVYGFDKRAAKRGEWRVTEATLKTIDLVGGIAGGLVGQWAFRHKTRKTGFIVSGWLTVLLHVAILATLLLGLWSVPELLFVR